MIEENVRTRLVASNRYKATKTLLRALGLPPQDPLDEEDAMDETALDMTTEQGMEREHWMIMLGIKAGRMHMEGEELDEPEEGEEGQRDQPSGTT